MKVLFGLFMLFAVNTVKAETVYFEGTIDSTCSILLEESGRLDLDTQRISTASPARALVIVSDGNAYGLNISQPQEFNLQPDSFEGRVTLTGAYTLEGANNIQGVQSFSTLENAGISAAAITVEGTSTQPMTKGDYRIATVIECNAF